MGEANFNVKSVLVVVGVTCTFAVLASPFTFAKRTAQRIENRRWRITKYRGHGTQKGDEQGLVNAAKTAEITFSRGHIRGSPTCGGLVGTYTLRRDALTVQVDLLLAGFCPPDQLAQDQLVLNALKGDLRIDEKNDHVLLRDKEGQARVLLIPY